MSILQSQGAGGENIHQQGVLQLLRWTKPYISSIQCDAAAAGPGQSGFYCNSCASGGARVFFSTALRRDYHERQRRSGYFSGAPDARVRKLPRIFR